MEKQDTKKPDSYHFGVVSMYEQANRPFPDFPVDIPLPLYVCSVGKRGGESGSGHVPPLLSQFIGMTFCVRGSGVAYLFDRPFRMRENDVIFYYPHEEHRFLSDSEESVVAWVNFDGPLAMSIFSSYRFPRFFPRRRSTGSCSAVCRNPTTTRCSTRQPSSFCCSNISRGRKERAFSSRATSWSGRCGT